MTAINPIVLRVEQAAQLLCVSKTAVWNWCNPKSPHYNPDFPKPFKVGANVTAWKTADIEDYINHIAQQAQIDGEARAAKSALVAKRGNR